MSTKRTTKAFALAALATALMSCKDYSGEVSILSAAVESNTNRISRLKSQIEKITDYSEPRVNVEKIIKDIVDLECGDLSERHKKIELLILVYGQQEARLSNVEQLLANF